MQKPSLPLRVIVLASSLLLAVGYLSYRAGAFSWLRGGATPASEPQEIGDIEKFFMISGTKSAPVLADSDLPPLPEERELGEMTILPSTKFAPIVPNSEIPPVPSDKGTTGKVMIMSGWKSDAGLSP